MQKITNFFKYNNGFILIIGFLFLAAGSSFASETVRDAVIGQTIEEVRGMDNSALLAANLSSLKQEMSITDVSEDEENYYVSYIFSTLDVKDYFWQNQNKTQTLKVSKDVLKGGEDLGLYVQKELSQVMDAQLAYLKTAQEKEQKKGETKPIKTVKYTGLKGLVLNSETKELEGYEPVVKKAESSSSESSSDSSSSVSSASSNSSSSESPGSSSGSSSSESSSQPSLGATAGQASSETSSSSSISSSESSSSASSISSSSSSGDNSSSSSSSDISSSSSSSENSFSSSSEAASSISSSESSDSSSSV